MLRLSARLPRSLSHRPAAQPVRLDAANRAVCCSCGIDMMQDAAGLLEVRQATKAVGKLPTLPDAPHPSAPRPPPGPVPPAAMHEIADAPQNPRSSRLKAAHAATSSSEVKGRKARKSSRKSRRSGGTGGEAESVAGALLRHGVRVGQEGKRESARGSGDDDGDGDDGDETWNSGTAELPGRVTETDGWEEGALHIAAAKGDAYTLSLLIGDRLAAGKTPAEALDGVDGNLWTALHYACQLGEPKSVEMLLDAGCATNVLDATGWTPVHEAAWNGHGEVLALLLRRIVPERYRSGASSNSFGSATSPIGSRQSGSSTAIEAAAAAAAAAEASRLDAQDQDGWTALHAAAYAADGQCVALLLQCGATAAIQDHSVQTPAIVASAQGALDIAAVLLGDAPVQSLVSRSAAVAVSPTGSNSSSASSKTIRKKKKGRTKGLRTPSPAVTWSRSLVGVETRKELHEEALRLGSSDQGRGGAGDGGRMQQRQSISGGFVGSSPRPPAALRETPDEYDDERADSVLDMDGLISRTGLSLPMTPTDADDYAQRHGRPGLGRVQEVKAGGSGCFGCCSRRKKTT
eukprot:COSAG05_NODE_766_length_7469_cov_7.800543_2_plen_575_part_00